MFVSVLAAGLFLMADVTPAAQPTDAPAAQAAAKPEMKKVCFKVRSTDSNMPRTTCKMVPVDPPEEVAKTDESAAKPQ